MIKIARCRGGVGQRGFTMVELLVAIAIAAVIVVGSLALLWNMVTVADENQERTIASMEVQYVGFWISEDVIQAQCVEVGNATTEGVVTGFPLVIRWRDDSNNMNNRVTYTLVEQTEQNGMYQLQRKHEAGPQVGNVTVYETLNESIVGRYLVVGYDTEDLDSDGNTTELSTGVWRNQKTYVSYLSLQATAKVDRSVASNEYEIHPRTYSIWEPDEEKFCPFD